MEIRLIKTNVDYDIALRRMIDIRDPIDAIKFRLEQEGRDYSALIGVIGQRTRVYEVMRRSRPLSLNMIRRLHARLAIPAEVLIQSTHKKARPSFRDRIRTSRKTRSVRRAR